MTPFLNLLKSNSEIIQIFISFISSILLPIFVFCLLRKTEGIKQEIGRRSSFSVRWADEFLKVYSLFLDSIDNILTSLSEIQSLSNQQINEEKKKERLKNFEKNINDSVSVAIKSNLRISTMMSSFPEIDSSNLNQYMNDIIKPLNEIIQTKNGSFDPIKKSISLFSQESRNIHSILLKI